MMFKKGDRVIDAAWLVNGEVQVGTIRAKYRRHYLVSYGGQIRHECESDLLPEDSPMIKRLLQLADEISGHRDAENACRELGLRMLKNRQEAETSLPAVFLAMDDLK